ncbi:MAG: DRTGG domain-containing protein [Bacteroidales bacterium]|jgi:predicted transcriptional regulator
MKIREIAEVLDAKIIVGEHRKGEDEVLLGFASDLMSDVLTLEEEKVLLITGLCNIQTIRTAEMANIDVILFVRNKEASEEMIELAEENDMVLMQSKFSMFKTVGLLYGTGMQPIY